jgi:hypothetical protein
MKKRLASIGMALTMALACMPVFTVNAADTMEVKADYTLSGDKTTQIIIPSDATVTLDLNGYSLSVADNAILNYGNLTIIDTASNKKISRIYSSNLTKAAIVSFPNSTTVIRDCTVHSDGKYAIKNFGNMTIDNSYIGLRYDGTRSDSTADRYVIDNGWHNVEAEDTFAGTAYPMSSYSSSTANLTINSGVIDGKAYNSDTNAKVGIYNKLQGNLVMNGGVFTNCGTCVYNLSNAVLNDGTFKDGFSVQTGSDDVTQNQSTTVINGGTYSGTIANNSAKASTVIYDATVNTNFNLDGGSSLQIHSGSFANAEIDLTKYLAANASFTAAANNTDNTAGTVMTNTLAGITKYVFYNSIPTDVTFNYKIANVKGTTQGGDVVQEASIDGNKILDEVLDGPTPANVKFVSTNTNESSLSFGIDDFDAEKTVSDLSTAMQAVTTSSYYNSKKIFIDFSGVTFPGPGVYRYILKETSNNSYFTASDLYVDVWVARAGGTPGSADYTKYAATAAIVHTGSTLESTKDSTSEKVDNKVSYLMSESSMKAMNLTVKHISQGNQAPKTIDFAYTLTLANVTKDAVINFVRNDGIVGNIFVKKDNTLTYKFNLSDGQSITFKNMSEYPSYTVTTDETLITDTGLFAATKLENYKIATDDADTATAGTAPDLYTDETNTSGVISGTTFIDQSNRYAETMTSASDNKYTVKDTLMQSSGTVVMTVYKNGVIPTGVILNVAPYILVVLAGFFGLILFATKRRETEND